MGKVSFDWTVNLPTLIALIVLIGSTVTTGVTMYNSMATRMQTVEIQVQTQDKASATVITELRGRIDTNTADIRELRRDQTSNSERLRNELKGEMSRISDKLDTLILRGLPK